MPEGEAARRRGARLCITTSALRACVGRTGRGAGWRRARRRGPPPTSAAAPPAPARASLPREPSRRCGSSCCAVRAAAGRSVRMLYSKNKHDRALYSKIKGRGAALGGQRCWRSIVRRRGAMPTFLDAPDRPWPWSSDVLARAAPNMTGMNPQLRSTLVRTALGCAPGAIRSRACTSQCTRGPVVVSPVIAMVLLRWTLSAPPFSICWQHASPIHISAEITAEVFSQGRAAAIFAEAHCLQIGTNDRSVEVIRRTIALNWICT